MIDACLYYIFLKLSSKIRLEAEIKMPFQELQREIPIKELTPRPLFLSNSNTSSITTIMQNMKKFLKLLAR